MSIFSRVSAAALAGAAALLTIAPAGAQTPAPDLSKMLVCRPATTGEKPVAMMGTTALICKPLAVVMKQADGSMKRIGNPDAANPPVCDSMKGLTTQQQDNAISSCLQKSFGSILGHS